GTLLLARGKPAEAKQWLLQARRNQDDPDLACLLGRVHSSLGELREAEAAFRHALELAPKHPSGHWGLGGLLLKRGRFAEAQSAFEKAQKFGQEDPRLDLPFAEKIAECRRLKSLDDRLRAVLENKDEPPAPDEALDLAWLCKTYKNLPETAA